MESCASFSGEFNIRDQRLLHFSGSCQPDYCQSVMVFDNVVLDLSLCGNKYLYP